MYLWPARQSLTAAEGEASSPEKRMWQTTYEFHYTYVTEQNALTQKYLLNTSSVLDTFLDSGETTVNKKDKAPHAYIPLMGKTIRKYSVNT